MYMFMTLEYFWVSFSVFDIWFEGTAKRIARRSSAKCYKDMGYGNRTQDSRTGH
jgi:hypothetical protein